MEKNEYYYQVDLLVKILPLLESETKFALKGGTAINLFIRNFPRYSVDIDLVYLPIEDRNTSLADISEALNKLAEKVARLVPGTQVKKKITGNEQRTTKLFVQRKNDLVKVEPNEILRGYVYKPLKKSVCSEVSEEFSTKFSTLIANPADLYAGKICAALDRQHPRDLFDVKLLLNNEGLTQEIRKAFVVYLVCHNRPMDELLKPNLLDIESVFETQFKGLTKKIVTCEELISARKELIALLGKLLENNEKDFIFSIAKGIPRWDLMEFNHIQNLPALKWKVQNIKKIGRQKHLESISRLEKVLNKL